MEIGNRAISTHLRIVSGTMRVFAFASVVIIVCQGANGGQHKNLGVFIKWLKIFPIVFYTKQSIWLVIFISEFLFKI